MKKPSTGFTLIELIVVIVIIAILATISIVGFTNIQQGARNTQRSSQITSLAEALEKYYMKNGEYPMCATIAAPVSINTVATTILPGIDPNLLTAPLAPSGTNSIVCTDPSSATQYGYVGGGNSYTLKYMEESTGSIIPKGSRHHAISPNYTLALTGNHCTPTGAGSYPALTVVSYGCTPDPFYVFNDTAGQSNNGWTGDTGCTTGINITINDPKTCNGTAVVATPSLPTPWPPTFVPTGSTTLTWTSTAPTCSGGNTLEYRYDYSIYITTPGDGSDSGWVTISSSTTSLIFTTTDDGHHYNLALQAHCKNVVGGDSGWTTSATWSKYIASPQCYLTVNSAGNGSVSGGNQWFDCGISPDTPTISASPNSNYGFDSWTGTGCTGGSSNPVGITVTGNITCTANFVAIPYCTLTVISNGNGTVGGGGTYDCRNSSTSYAYAYPSTYYYFTGWTGCSGGGSNPAGFTMNSNITCYANFGVIDITPGAPSVWYNGVWGAQVNFVGGGSCTGPNATIYYQFQANNGGTVLEGPSGVTTTTNFNTTTFTTPGTTYTFYVRAYCVNPVTSSGWGAWGSTNYYRDYWWAGLYSGTPAWVYYTDDGTQRRYKTTDTANSAPQANGDYLYSPQAYPAIDFTNYPAQNNCKAIGGRTPVPNELIAMAAARNMYGTNFYHNNFTSGEGYRSEQQRTDDHTMAWNIEMSSSALWSSNKTNSNPVRCVHD